MKISDEDKIYIYNRDEKQCYFCKTPLEFNQITFDHYMPRSKSGTMDVFNLVTCCKRCNKLKGSRVPEDCEDTILALFLKAVNDDRIRGCNMKIKHKELRSELLKIYKIEALTDHFIFQSSEKRFYVRDNMVYKFVYVATSPKAAFKE
jgi:hypothetical protein